MRRPLCIISGIFMVTVMCLLWQNPPPSYSFSGKEGEICLVEGTVYQKEQKDTISYIYLKDIHLKDMHLIYSQNSPKGILCYMEESAQQIRIGSKIQIEGKVRSFQQATNPGEFNRKEYWSLQGIELQAQNCKLKKCGTGYDKWKEGLYEIRSHLEKRVDALYDPKCASLMKAMLLGNKKELDTSVKELYQKSGIAHILAISGLHITLLGMGLFNLFRKGKVPLFLAAGGSIFIMLQYGQMTGMSHSAYRAIFMFSLRLLSVLLGRSYDMLTAMALAAVILILEQPLYVFQAGFQLSFGAILGMGILYPMFESAGAKCRETGIRKRLLFCKKQLSGSLSVFLATLPVTLFHYYQIPLWGIFLNLCVLSLLAGILIFGIVSLLLSFLSSALALYATLPVVFIAAFYEKLCNLALTLPGAVQITGKPSAYGIFLFYGGLWILSYFAKRASTAYKTIFLATVYLLLTLRVNTGITVTALDIGQGDCFVLKNENLGTYLIDSGSSSQKEIARYKVIPYLKSQGIIRLRYVFASHSDKDHTSGILELLQQAGEPDGIKIEALVLPKIGDRYEDETFKELVKCSKEQGIPVLCMKKGDEIQEGKLKIVCLYPSENSVFENANETSQVLWVSYEGFDGIFTGDIEGSGETQLLYTLRREKERGNMGEIELLKAAHHGSKNSTSQEFLEKCEPLVVFISSGKQNAYGHPHEELLDRLRKNQIPWYNTAQCGAMRLTYGNGIIKVYQFLKDTNSS